MRPLSLIALAALTLATACSRPLTQSETVFAKNLFGDTIETDTIIVAAGLGITPLPLREKPKPQSVDAAAPPPRKAPDDLCVRKPSPRRAWDWPAAFVLNETVYFSYRYYPFDAFEGMPESVPFPASLIMAHELVHVWQWQNRKITNYTSLASGSESLKSKDPYFWVPTEGREFLSYGYEQQAAIIEDFVCYTLFDPEDPAIDELAAILRPIIPVDDFLTATGRR